MLNLTRVRDVLLACLLGASYSLFAQSISITIEPPPLPVCEQPPCPGDGYFWVPGYWAYGEYGYFWVHGYWIVAPEPGLLWTPGYWGYAGSAYIWHGGYWGPRVGYYGGINYGFGYYGSGFHGGSWEGGAFHYNTAVWKVDPSVVGNTYVDRTVINNRTEIYSHTSFNGPGGNEARPTAEQEAAAHERRIDPTDRQRAYEENALHDPNQRYSVNHGHPNSPAETGAGEHHEAEQHGGEHHEVERHEGEHHEGEHHHASEHQGGEHQGGEHHHEGEHHEGGQHGEGRHQEHHPSKQQPEKRSRGNEQKGKK